MKIKWWHFPAGLGGAVVVTCLLGVLALYLYAFANIAAMGFVLQGHKHYDNGEYEEAVKWYDRALKLRPVIARGHFQHDKGKALAKLGRFEEALESYDEALPYLEKSDIAFIVYENRADALVGLGRWEEAVEAYRQALSHTPDAWEEDPSSEGDFEYREENYAKAIACFEAAAKTDPDNYEWHHKIGLSWLALGRYAKAVSNFDVAIELAPDYGPAWERKALALGLWGRYDAALACADRARALDADAPEAWNTKGKILLYSGDAGGARRCFGRALAPYPSSPEALLATGMTYFAEADYDEARPYFEELVVGEGGSTYYLLYLYLIDRAEGHPRTGRLQPLLEAPDPWPKKISLFLIGRISADDLIAGAEGDRVLLCGAHFFIAYKNKLGGDAAAARRHFGEAVRTRRHDLAEYSLARYEWAHLDAAGE